MSTVTDPHESTRPPRVLLVAEMCNPDWSSVPLVGWFHSQALRGVADVHLVTHERNAEHIRARGLIEGTDFTAVPAPALERPLTAAIAALGASIRSNKGWTTQTAVASLTYPAFERNVWAKFADGIRARRFDVIHRLTPVTPAVPSPLAGLARSAGVPFVMGPVNGGLPWPPEFAHLRVHEREWLGYIRRAHKWMPAYHATRRNASAILVGSRSAFDDLPARYQSKAVYLPENAVDISLFQRRAAASPPPPLRVAFVGRLAAIKGVDMLIEAIAPLAHDGRLTLVIIGDGSEAPNLNAVTARLGLERHVTFTGWVKHEELRDHLEQCHVFAFPSIHEFGGAVVLEAMALGIVPVVVDYGGPGELVGPASGLRVPIGSPAAIVAGLREMLTRLVENPGILGPVAERARRRVEASFTWEAKARQVLEVYRWTMGLRDRPDFGMPFREPA